MIVAVLAEKGGLGRPPLPCTWLAGGSTPDKRSCLLMRTGRVAPVFGRNRDTVSGGPLRRRCRSSIAGCCGRSETWPRRYDDIVVDIGSWEGASIESVLRVADIAILPVQPNGLDIWTVGLLDELTGAALENNDGLKVWAVLNRASPHDAGRDVQDALTALQACRDIEVSDLVIRERSSIRRAVPSGLLVNEYRPRDQKATEEFSDLYRLVFGEDPPSHETNDGELTDNEYEHQAK